jgi:hypothetical protein
LRNLRLRRHTSIRLPAARRGDHWNVSVNVSGFKKAGVRYERVAVYHRYRAR